MIDNANRSVKHVKKEYLDYIKLCRDKKDTAVRNFEDSIISARDAGCTLREIEKVAGISNPAVLYLERKVRARKPKIKKARRVRAFL